MCVYQSVIKPPFVWLAVVMTLAPSVALAHAEQGRVAGFLASFSHPLSGWDHVVAMVAVGLWGAQLGAPAVWLLPVNFPMMMAVGGLLGLLGMALPAVEIGIAGSALVLGLVVATEARPALCICMAIVGVLAIFHGHAHGTELTPRHQRARLQPRLRGIDGSPTRCRNLDRAGVYVACRAMRHPRPGGADRSSRHPVPVACYGMR